MTMTSISPDPLSQSVSCAITNAIRWRAPVITRHKNSVEVELGELFFQMRSSAEAAEISRAFGEAAELLAGAGK